MIWIPIFEKFLCYIKVIVCNRERLYYLECIPFKTPFKYWNFCANYKYLLFVTTAWNKSENVNHSSTLPENVGRDEVRSLISFASKGLEICFEPDWVGSTLLFLNFRIALSMLVNIVYYFIQFFFLTYFINLLLRTRAHQFIENILQILTNNANPIPSNI